jgi:uncharacterized membrane protein
MPREFNSLVYLRLVPAVIMLGGIAIALSCFPLVMGSVAPNHTYGIRTALAFSSDENWYRVNRLGGSVLAGTGALVALIGAVGLVVPTRGLIVYVCAAPVLSFATLIGLAVWITTWR